MAHEIIPDQPNKSFKRYNIKMPDLTGKFGLSLCFGTKEIFIGVAIARIEMETVVKRRKLKVLKKPGKATFIPI